MDKLKVSLVVAVGLLFSAVVGLVVFVNLSKPVIQKIGSAETNATYNTDTNVTTKWDSGYFWGNLEVAGTSYLGNDIQQNSLLTSVSYGSFADATTTLFCVLNPNSATSTVDLSELLVSGPSTTTVNLVVTTSTVNVGVTTTTVTGSGSLIPGATLLANTAGVQIMNGLTNVPLTGVSAGSGSASLIQVRPDEYICGVAGDGASGSTAGVTNPSNTFAGTYKLRWLR